MSLSNAIHSATCCPGCRSEIEAMNRSYAVLWTGIAFARWLGPIAVGIAAIVVTALIAWK